MFNQFSFSSFLRNLFKKMPLYHHKKTHERKMIFHPYNKHVPIIFVFSQLLD